MTAQWEVEADIYKITLNNQSATSAGTTAIYEKKDVGWYSNSAATSSISSITVPSKTNYVFAGYYSSASCAGTKRINAKGKILENASAYSAATTLYACWASITTESISLATNGTKEYAYSGYSVVQATLSKKGYYKLEVWGAQGGAGQNDSLWGYGGYSVGVYQATNTTTKLYIVVGGAGGGSGSGAQSGGYNGGGSAISSGNNTGAGGGATHIATTNGLLSSLSSSANQAEVLIVAGGGGGAGDDCGDACARGSGGGYRGSIGSGSARGTQTSGYAFGEGETMNVSADSGDRGAGGGGWYGGKGASTKEYGGSGGSGYIGNSLLVTAKSVTKQMYQYTDGCSSSTTDSTKTTCTSNTGAHVANKANTGDGYAKITYLGT